MESSAKISIHQGSGKVYGNKELSRRADKYSLLD